MRSPESFSPHEPDFWQFPENRGSLQSLEIGPNFPTEALSYLPELTQLKELLIYKSHLRQAPEGLENLVNLEHLLVGKNSFEGLPEGIWELTQLKRLRLIRQQNLPDLSRISRLQNLRELSIIKCGISALPEEIGQLPNLEQLELSMNPLSVLPSRIGGLQKLRSLVITDCLRGDPTVSLVVPEPWAELGNLRLLDLHNSGVRELPPEITRLYNLEELNLDENQLIEIPALTGFPMLRKLHLSGNAIEDLKLDLAHPSRLTHLDLSLTSLREFPDLTPFSNLEYLDISLVDDCPPPNGLESLKKLKELWAVGQIPVEMESKLEKALPDCEINS